MPHVVRLSSNGESQSVEPSKLVCIGRNYVDHIAELGNEVPTDMVVFIKPHSAISSDLHAFHNEPLHYECELCFMVENNRFAYIGLGLDLTKRALQSQLKSKGLPWERAKAFDGAAVLSEFVPLPQEWQSISFELAIDGKPTQHGDTELMINKPATILSGIQEFMTLSDGDVVMTGTPKGVGQVEAGQIFTGNLAVDGQPLISASWQAE